MPIYFLLTLPAAEIKAAEFLLKVDPTEIKA
jgi:hypothetical protein